MFSHLFPRGWSFERKSYPCQSSTHQTLLGKALYEHGNMSTVAAVASSSSSIQNSSLGPNLLNLITLNYDTVDLFMNAFSAITSKNEKQNNNSHQTTLQFTPKMEIDFAAATADVTYGLSVEKILEFLSANLLVQDQEKSEENQNNKNNNNSINYFFRSLQTLMIHNPPHQILPLLKNMVGLTTLKLLDVSDEDHSQEFCQNLAVLSTLPNLKTLWIYLGEDEDSERILLDCDENFYKNIADVGTSLEALHLYFGADPIDESAFIKHFCHRLFAKNHLKTLFIHYPNQITSNENICDEMIEANMTSIEDTNLTAPAKLAHSFLHLQSSVFHEPSSTDDDVIELGKHCREMQSLSLTGFQFTGRLLSSEKLDVFPVTAASQIISTNKPWQSLRTLSLSGCGTGLNEAAIGNGFSRLSSLTDLCIIYSLELTGSFLQHLEGKLLQKLKLCGCVKLDDELTCREISRFTNLEILDLSHNPTIGTSPDKNGISQLTTLTKLKKLDLNMMNPADEKIKSMKEVNILSKSLGNSLEILNIGYAVRVNFDDVKMLFDNLRKNSTSFKLKEFHFNKCRAAGKVESRQLCSWFQEHYVGVQMFGTFDCGGGKDKKSYEKIFGIATASTKTQK